MLLGFSVDMEAFDELLSINVPWSQSSLLSSGFGLKLPALVFSLIFTVASRLLHLYCTIDKTSRLPLRGPLAPLHSGCRKSDDRRVSIWGTLGMPPPIPGAAPAP